MKEKPRIYLDTSVISALFDERNPERMNLTNDFFKTLGNYEAFISEITSAELKRTPDPQIRAKMERAIASFPQLPAPDGTAELAGEYMREGAVPLTHPEDAYHIAVAVASGMQFLLSWNFKHIVRMKTRNIIQAVNRTRGLPEITILTPGELL
jgi:predicted nucleic acid-binding protein